MSAALRYPPVRSNNGSMLMILDTHPFLPRAAEAASASPCWHKPVNDGRQAGYEPALAERWMR